MGKEYPKWLVGCGVGCLAVIVLAFIVGLGGFLTFRKVAGGFKDAQQAVSKVEDEFGVPEAYTPEPDGRIPADRIEAFLAVRNATSSVRSRLGARVEELEAMTDDRDPNRNKSGLQKFLTVMRTGAGAIPRIAEFEQNRADALFANRMGLGEYWYIYTLAYYSSLKKDPGDGPRRLHTQDGGEVRIDDHTDPADVRESRREQMSRQVNRLFRRILLNTVNESKPAEKSPEKSPWVQAAEKEEAALEAKHDRIPWEDGLPPEIEESIRPFREELSRSYDPVLNPLEFMEFRDHQRGW